jgi:alpha-beta hydrolase superfamily lysophospholipase
MAARDRPTWGGWRADFNLIHAGHLCEALRKSGIAIWNVEYRRVGDPGGWPRSLDDVLLAVKRARRLQNVYQAKLVLVGHSAGAQLALLAAGRTKIPVVAFAAPTDFDAWASDAAVAFLRDADRREASPRPIGVQQVLVHGTDDPEVPFWLASQYVEAALARGDEAEVLALGGEVQRVAIARAPAAQPEMLFPTKTSALDVSVQATVMQLLASSDLSIALLALHLSTIGSGGRRSTTDIFDQPRRATPGCCWIRRRDSRSTVNE